LSAFSVTSMPFFGGAALSGWRTAGNVLMVEPVY
jgi:hypothetical protein